MHRRAPRRSFGWTLVLSCALQIAPGGALAQEPPEAPDSAAYAWHDSVMAAMGGEDAWERSRYFRFRWNVVRDGQVVSDRSHRWDRYTGDYRLETTLSEGESLVVVFNTNTQDGAAWVDTEPAGPAQSDSLIQRAYGMFINDTYWLLMPYKWRDPGVDLEYQGAVTDSAGTWHVVHLTFEGVGLTPGDRYWAYVSDRPPHLMRKWQYHLQGRESKGPMIRWANWQRFGPIMLATDRVPVEGGFEIRFREIQVSETVPPGAFDAPE